MKTELLNTAVSFNERWPRNGYMFLPTFLLRKGDVLIFDWKPKIENRKIKVEIEETDYKADYSQNVKNIATFDISNTESFEILKNGLYNIPIANPKEDEYDIGNLIIYRQCNSLDNYNQSPFPERYYDYHIVKEDFKYIKKCDDWGYRTEFGACLIKDYNVYDELKLIFDSSGMNYHASKRTDERITNTIFFTTNKGDKIIINSIKKDFEKFTIVTSIDKIDSIGLVGHLNKSSYFISNEDAIFKLQTYIYCNIYGLKDELPTDFIDLKIYRNTESDTIEFNMTHELFVVYNTVFNNEELEPIKKGISM